MWSVIAFGQPVEDDFSPGVSLGELIGAQTSNLRQMPGKPFYFEAQVRDSTTYEIYDAELARWTNHQRTYYSHNQQGQYSRVLQQGYFTDVQAWLNNNRITYGYNHNDKRTIETHWLWNRDIIDWERARRITFQYTHSGLTHFKTKQVWDSSAGRWLRSERLVYQYNQTGDSISVSQQTWNTGKGSWLTQTVQQNTFDARGNVQISINLLVNNDTGELINEERTRYFYETPNKLDSTIIQEWDTNLNTWGFISSTRLSYNNQGLPSTIKTKSYADGQSWEYQTQTAVSYDSVGNLVQRIKQRWDAENQSWINIYRKKYYWEKVIVTREPNELVPVDCRYLNPMPRGSQITCFNLPDHTYRIRIFDAQGRVYYEGELESEKPFEVPPLNRDGLFFFQVTGKRVNHAERFYISDRP